MIAERIGPRRAGAQSAQGVHPNIRLPDRPSGYVNIIARNVVRGRVFSRSPTSAFERQSGPTTYGESTAMIVMYREHARLLRANFHCRRR